MPVGKPSKFQNFEMQNRAAEEKLISPWCGVDLTSNHELSQWNIIRLGLQCQQSFHFVHSTYLRCFHTCSSIREVYQVVCIERSLC
jgi:hypothetical protein